MVLILRGGLILTNSKNEYLVVQYNRSKQFGFPKGEKDERFDTFTFDAGVRNMKYDTGFEIGKDYTVDLTHVVPALIQSEEENIMHLFYIGKTLKDDVYFTSNKKRHIDNIMFVPFEELVDLKLNHPTKIALYKYIKL
jgi:hypothetical protein